MPLKLTSISFSIIALLALAALPQLSAQETPMKKEQKKFALAIHGGAGTIERSKMTPDLERAYRDGLERSLRAGYDILEKGGSSLDAVEAAVRVLEDDPHFNAGKGAVFHRSGNERARCVDHGRQDAQGRRGRERETYQESDQSRAHGHGKITARDDGWRGCGSVRETKWGRACRPKIFLHGGTLEGVAAREGRAEKGGGVGGNKSLISERDRHGTVGAVALDQAGNLAAATSTGGTTNKKVGRIGDSPIIGAGTYANNATCAISATGDGEYFIRATVAHDISALMEYRGLSLGEAAQAVLDKVAKLGGTGGLIAIDRKGNITQPFNTAGMYRGTIDDSGRTDIAIYR